MGVLDSGGDGVSRQAFPLAGSGVQAGVTMRFQYWFRDPAAGGSGHNLTDALAMTFVP